MSSVSQLGKFEVTGQLGQGSFGVVYRGRDPHLNRDVAIKVCTLDDEELRQRFLREAAISGRLDHPNVVTVHEYSSEGPTPYLVQEFLSGEDLRQVIKDRRPWPVERRLEALLGIAEGLAYAHEQGVIHRDIKPANVFVLDDGRIKILDFGIAKLANDESRLTQKGVTMGTASYLPPEQVRGGEIDTRSDLFSFGVLAYELLTFERPFRGKTISALVYQILYKVPAPLSAVWPDCPDVLSDLVARCLDKEPEKRFAGAREIVEALSAIRDDVAGGRWPSLAAGVVPVQQTVREDEASASKSDLLSRSMISRAAHEAGARAAEETSTVTATVMQSRDSEATQPVPIMPLPTTAPPPKLPDPQEAATVAMSLSDLPQLGAPPGEEPEPDELATSGLEIAKLVAQGDLDAALEQLEETIHRRRGDETDDETGDDVSDDAPSAPLVPPPPPPAKTPGEQDLKPVPPAPQGRGKKQLPVPLVVGAVATVLVLALLFAIFGGRESAPEPTPSRAPLPAPPAPVAETEELGSLLVVSTPWAEVTEITDAAGFVHALPIEPTTPLHLSLPEGLYRVTIAMPAGDGADAEERICEVRVELGEAATCAEAVGEPTATQLFKDSGWWP